MAGSNLLMLRSFGAKARSVSKHAERPIQANENSPSAGDREDR
jgi:hypothetical protein